MKTFQNDTNIDNTIVESILSDLPFNDIEISRVWFDRKGYGQYNLCASLTLDNEPHVLRVHSTDSMLIDNWEADPDNYVGGQTEESIVVALRTIVRQLKDTF